MPSVPYTNTLRVVCRQTMLGEESINVHHLVAPAGLVLTTTMLNLIADDFEGFYTLSSSGSVGLRGIDELRPTNVTFASVSIYDLRVVPNPTPHVVNYTSPGATAPDVVPWDVAVTITLRTAVGGRSGRGRIYLGPLTQAWTAGSAVNPPQVAGAAADILANAYVDLVARLQATAGATGLTPGVLSIKDGICRPVTSITIDKRPDTQRRRDLSAGFAAPLNVTL